ncbi:Restriction endonuclease [Micromonospora pattaloongensis]|uniref:Restriction endonuclease n=1 Tax=Micromonospora pattaloongensis TaxID=405436 RepID=A0A1H3JWI6_9ACTN|nr:Restriction endonuclease [Micromonospora pattaloongensis]
MRVIAGSPNEKGDILTSLAQDVFHQLGYEDLRLNVPKSGREVDIQGSHKFERRRLVAECKAVDEPIGGADLNKFAGVLGAEQHGAPVPVHGYFLSVSGFRSSALEQERQIEPPRMTLMDGEQIVEVLEAGKVVAPQRQAIEVSGRFVGATRPELLLQRQSELLATAMGWIWAIYYRSPSGNRFACLVHPDGQLLSAELAESLNLEDFPEILAPATSEPMLDVNTARSVYITYLLTEFGAITLEGMPTDQEIGSRSFRLESLYVPPTLENIVRSNNEITHDAEDPPAQLAAEDFSVSNISLGAAISTHHRLAILGPPGGGKSTIIKRLAVAYADPSRRVESDDELPEHSLTPFVIRCRTLSAQPNKPIRDILNDLILWAERPDLADTFKAWVGESLRRGEVLLLVDGLDEIHVDTERSLFVNQLRVFLSTYPQIRAVITSREVGFRPIAGVVASTCHRMRVADLSDEGIHQLVHAWHAEVVGRGQKATEEAEKLVSQIVTMDRIRRLAGNPLLLTTLLLVRRWVGQLPRRRSVLYRKAIEVLLMTWNIEGHAPVDPDEVLPQLAFAAHQMMLNGKARVSGPELVELFKEARREMPDVLAYARTPPSKLVERIEERSSLLSLSGYDVKNGEIVAMYEFRHLTFQEYLAALAIVQDWLPGELSTSNLVEKLEPFLRVGEWKEVVTLAVALSGRNAGSVLRALDTIIIEPPPSDSASKEEVEEYWERVDNAASNAFMCLADDVLIDPALAADIIRHSVEAELSEYLDIGGLIDSRYAETFYEVSFSGVKEGRHPLVDYVHNLAEFVGASQGTPLERWPEISQELISSTSLDERLRGLALLLYISWDSRARDPQDIFEIASFDSLGYPVTAAARLLAAGATTRAETIMVQWVLGWLGELLDTQMVAEVLPKLLHNWMSEDADINEFAPWAISSLPVVVGWNADQDKDLLERFLGEQFAAKDSRLTAKKRAALTVAFEQGIKWNRDSLRELASALITHEKGDSARLWIRKFHRLLDEEAHP